MGLVPYNLNARFRIKQFYIVADSWTPISCPIECNFATLANIGSASMALSSNPDDVTAWEPLLPGDNSNILAPLPTVVAMLNPKPLAARFPSGSPLCYAKADANQTILLVKFVL